MSHHKVKVWEVLESDGYTDKLVAVFREESDARYYVDKFPSSAGLRAAPSPHYIVIDGIAYRTYEHCKIQ